MLGKPSISAVILVLVVAAGSHLPRAAAQTPDNDDEILIQKLELDRTEVAMPCRPGYRARSGACNDNPVIAAKATVALSKVRDYRLESIVSGGRVIGGKAGEFIWDLGGVAPGTYVITVYAVDKNGRRRSSKSATVRIADCKSCASSDYCPTFSVVVPRATVPAGESIRFKVEIAGMTDTATTYSWTVTAGTITRGQGTPEIEVETTLEMAGSSVFATVELANPGWLMTCSLTASESVFLERPPEPAARLFDEFLTRGNNCEEGFSRMDAFFAELSNEPGATGAVILYDDAARSGSARRRKTQLMNFLKMRRFDPTRIRFLDGTLASDARTQFWIVPAGAELPAVLPGLRAAAPSVEMRRDKPYLFASESADGIPGCGGNLYDLAEYAEALKADKVSLARIIISETSFSRFRAKQKEILSELRTHGISPSRISTVYVHVAPMHLGESTELWIIPTRRPPRS